MEQLDDWAELHVACDHTELLDRIKEAEDMIARDQRILIDRKREAALACKLAACAMKLETRAQNSLGNQERYVQFLRDQLDH